MNVRLLVSLLLVAALTSAKMTLLSKDRVGASIGISKLIPGDECGTLKRWMR